MRVAVLGATGLVGQKFVALLHKWFPWHICEVVASETKYSQTYGSACVWQESLGPMPESMARVPIRRIEDIESDIIVSFLPEGIAESLETYCLSKGKLVFSNASAYRMHPAVPILIPEVNQDHMSLVVKQPFSGRIITNSNCCVSGIALALSPLQEFGIDRVNIVTLQSASGAGHPGVSSMDVLGNTIPHIVGEEEKIHRETLKILGKCDEPAHFPIAVSVHRVPVVYGHTLTLHVTFLNSMDIEEILHSYHRRNEEFPGTYKLYDTLWHPQARKDLTDDDMRVHIGPITYGGGDFRTIKMNILIHNLVRGAAGALLTNMHNYCFQHTGEYACLQ
ncbi:aspartate-semialdehyde dehydrogenase [Chlamydia caviae]|uniref:Aspartate-semialdehyde dehydrogenase n=1 Tax=Chlamydia caviae (strain ATCC VR-813 / DSM 19441 / 03DC25 / GPIC) TaxID=227941 RepID=Q822G8_CHLCV|nr:aspartate-semialdehyde dehydrogenase [Chlamydia caviae]AAP05456.1 aspartate-semialdehyde dehydrogenase [Chlamydia caviae GPIC]